MLNWLLGHRCNKTNHSYQARYDYGAPQVINFRGSGDAEGVVAVMEASKQKTYVHDVCVHCGNVIKR